MNALWIAQRRIAPRFRKLGKPRHFRNIVALAALLLAALPVDAQETAPASAPESQPAPTPDLIGQVQHRLAAAALVGLWISDTEADHIRLSFDAKGIFTLDDTKGRYMTAEDRLILWSGGREASYQFELADETLILRGGQLKKDLRFLRQANVLDYVRKLLHISPVTLSRKLFRILIIVAIVVAARLVILAIRGVLALLVLSDWGPMGLMWRYNKSRALTVHSLVLNGVKYLIYFTALGFILSELGINYTAYLASLSVVGLAIGFGSQGLVQDMVTGFFVIFEAQFDVGDMVEISGQVGVVSELGLRMTKLRNYIGQTVMIPNRFIAVVGNFTRGAQPASIDVAIPGPEALEKASRTLEQIGLEIARQFSGVILTSPTVTGPIDLATGEHFVRLQVSLWPQQVWVVDTQLLPRIREVFEREGLAIPKDRIAVTYHGREEKQFNDWRELVRGLKERLSERRR